MTDPEQMLLMELADKRKSDLSAIQDMYLKSNGYDGLGELLEAAPTTTKKKPSNALKRKKVIPKVEKVSKTTNTSDPSAPAKLVQFKGLSRTARIRSSEPRAATKVGEKAATQGRSSTMPGFSERGPTDREKAYKDGIKLAERRSGKDLSKVLNTDAAKKERRRASGQSMYRTSSSVPDSMIQFADEIHDIDRITPKEEITLGEKTQEAIQLQNVYDDLKKNLCREPTPEEWCAASGKINMEAISQAIEEGLEAKNTLVTANLRMVQGVVNLYIRNGLGAQYNAGDLMQEGVMALVRAAEKFDPKRGFRFSTYAMYWIRSAVKRDQIYQSRVITVPQRLYENHKRILRVDKELRIALDRPPTKKELGDAVGMSQIQVERCLRAMSQRCFSMDQQMTNTKKPMSGDADQDTMYEIVESKNDDSGDVKRVFFREDLVNALFRHLTEEEANLLLLRYGLTDSETPNMKPNGNLMTIAEISRIVELKPDKVRRLINKSLRELKTSFSSESWVEYEREMR